MNWVAYFNLGVPDEVIMGDPMDSLSVNRTTTKYEENFEAICGCLYSYGFVDDEKSEFFFMQDSPTAIRTLFKAIEEIKSLEAFKEVTFFYIFKLGTEINDFVEVNEETGDDVSCLNLKSGLSLVKN